MQVFAVFNISRINAVRQKVEERYPGNFRQEGNCLFLETEGETTREVAEKIGFGQDNLSSGIVLPVTSYWGRADPELWEWISVKMDANGK